MPDAAFDMLQFGLRLGARPRQLVTTTPRPIALIKRLIADPRTAVTRASTHANAAHLSPAFLDEVIGRYAGTRLGRQEIDGEIIEERADALWSRADDRGGARARSAAASRIVIGIDPPGSARPGADACGIVAAGLGEDGRVYVLEDASVQGLAPPGWATQGGRALPAARGRRAGRRGQPGRRHGARGAGAGRPGAAGAHACTRRAASGCAPSRSPCCMRKARSSTSIRRCRAGGRDVRLRPRRPVGRPLARPARRAGLGGDGADEAGRVAGAEDQEVVRLARAVRRIFGGVYWQWSRAAL